MKHEDVVEQVKKHFTKLSSNPITTSQLVAEEPAVFTGSEVWINYLVISSFSLYVSYEFFLLVYSSST